MQIFANNDNTELKDIPANLEIPIKSCISQLLKSKQDESSIISKYTNSNATCLALDYQLKVSEYYEIKDKPVFPIAYAAIASAKDFTMFDTLLKLESKYSSSVSSLINDHKNQSDQVKFNHEMQLDQFNSQETSPEIITLLLQNQLEEFEALEMKQLAQLNNLYESQKIEYRDFVVKLYTELKDRAVADPAASLKRSSFVDVANTSQDLLIPKVVPKLLKSPSLEMLSVIDSTDSKNEVKTDPKILQIQELGFSDIDAEAALDMKRNDLQAAVAVLFENPDLVARHASVLQKLKKKKEQPVQSNLRASSSFSNIATKSKLQSLNSNESNESKIIRSSSQKNISQGEEKKTIKRMASFFGQALEALGLDDAESRSEASRGISHADKSELSETFTIFYGTQVRQMWNIRLIASKFEDVLLPSLDSTQELAMRTQTLSNLYGHDLSAAILLTTRNQFQNYMKIGTRSKFILKCKSSTEFHFNDISTQLETIYKSNQNFQEGDFFVTRHSNIPNIHAVFHLIISDDSISTDVTSQSKLITGYRSILKTCQLCDVHNITIPLLLLDDDIVSDTTFVTNKSQTTSIEQVLYKRCELVLKSTKGLIQEYSRGIKHAGQTGGVDKFPRSLTFVLPVLRGESQSGFSRTRVVYGAVREKLAEIFRQY